MTPYTYDSKINNSEYAVARKHRIIIVLTAYFQEMVYFPKYTGNSSNTPKLQLR